VPYRSPPSRGRDRQTLIDAIAAEELALARLAREERDSRARLATLQAELGAVDQQPEMSASAPSETWLLAPHSPADKVALVRRWFRGREDVFPTRFTSQTTGKAGYAPACRNKFRPGVCDLPRIKCGECPNQAFVPFGDGALLAPLQGRHVMGVCPLLADHTCWFLAVDFDKGAWADDVIAFVETSRRSGRAPVRRTPAPQARACRRRAPRRALQAGPSRSELLPTGAATDAPVT
jgi:hypothetical protein